MNARMGREPKIPLTRSLGRFVGHIWHAAKTPAPEREREEVARRSDERTGEIDGKSVVLRRTTVDEVEYKQR